MCKIVRYNIKKYLKTYKDNIVTKKGLRDSTDDNEVRRRGGSLASLL